MNSKSSLAMRSHLLMGPVGAGKQTQVDNWIAFLATQGRTGVQISTGNIVAWNRDNETALGLAAAPYYARGELVPNELIFAMLEEYFKTLVGVTDLIWDGFPRSPKQYEEFLKFAEKLGAPLHSVVLLMISDAVAIERLTTGRLVCPEGHSYHEIHNPPAVKGVCHCGKPLEARVDDILPKIQSRLATFHQETEPILSEVAVPVLRVDAERSITQVKEQLLGLLASTM